MTSLEALLKEGTKVLEEKKIQEARLDAWLLLEYVTVLHRPDYTYGKESAPDLPASAVEG